MAFNYCNNFISTSSFLGISSSLFVLSFPHCWFGAATPFFVGFFSSLLLWWSSSYWRFSLFLGFFVGPFSVVILLLGDLFLGFLVGLLLGDLFLGFLVGLLLGDLFLGFLVGLLLGDLFLGFLVSLLLGDLFLGFLVGLLLGDLFLRFLVGLLLGLSRRCFFLGFFCCFLKLCCFPVFLGFLNIIQFFQSLFNSAETCSFLLVTLTTFRFLRNSC